MGLQRKNKLGQLLLDEGLVSEADLRRALESASKGKKRLGEALVDLGLLSPKAMLSALGKQLGVKASQLRHGLIDPAIARLLDR
ncbi:MAG: secretion system protein E, partial [Planctomycetota bacterium]